MYDDARSSDSPSPRDDRLGHEGKAHSGSGPRLDDERGAMSIGEAMLLMGLRDVKESKELLDELEELYEPNPNMVDCVVCETRVFADVG